MNLRKKIGKLEMKGWELEQNNKELDRKKRGIPRKQETLERKIRIKYRELERIVKNQQQIREIRENKAKNQKEKYKSEVK